MCFDHCIQTKKLFSRVSTTFRALRFPFIYWRWEISRSLRRWLEKRWTTVAQSHWLPFCLACHTPCKKFHYFLLFHKSFFHPGNHCLASFHLSACRLESVSNSFIAQYGRQHGTKSSSQQPSNNYHDLGIVQVLHYSDQGSFSYLRYTCIQPTSRWVKSVLHPITYFRSVHLVFRRESRCHAFDSQALQISFHPIGYIFQKSCDHLSAVQRVLSTSRRTIFYDAKRRKGLCSACHMSWIVDRSC